ncbi:MAG: ATP-binding protein [Planctomycetes bacterium]|nr:ATP-binding protein [Planctomycetota bacterium]
MARLLLMEHVGDNTGAAELLAANPSWDLLEAFSPHEALAKLQVGIDLLLAHISLSKSDGGEFVSHVRELFPRLPILLIACDQDHDTLVKALLLGAASYVPRGRLARELVGTVERLLALTGREYRRRLAECLARGQTRLVFGNDRQMIPVVVGHVQDCAEDFGLCHERDSFRLAVALEEALANALVHGNLEVSSELRGQNGNDSAYADLISIRLEQEPYCRRKIMVDVTFDDREVRTVITDEGPGFDPSRVADPTDPRNLAKPYGRGMMLMKAFMDEVRYNDRGTQVTLIKRRRS